MVFLRQTAFIKHWLSFQNINFNINIDLSSLFWIDYADNIRICNSGFEELEEANCASHIDILNRIWANLKQIFFKVIVCDLRIMRLDVLEQLLCKIFELFLRKLWHQKCEIECSKLDHALRCRTAQQYFVVFIDLWFKGRMLRNQIQQIGVLLRRTCVDSIED